MTDQQHPITPPPELRRLWAQQAQRVSPLDPVEWLQHVSEKAAQWGADTELEACRMEIIYGESLFYIDDFLDRVRLADDLRAARRPKPPSAVEQAKELIESHEDGWCPNPSEWNIILEGLAEGRRALEALPND